MILAVTGLLREADIAASAEVRTVAGGGKASLAARLEEALAEGAAGIISIGIAGGLASALNPGDCVVASEVIGGGERYATDPEWTARIAAALPIASLGCIAGMDEVIAHAAGKAELHRATGALAVDMESHVVARVAQAHRIPFAALRTIADAANSQLPPLVASALNEDGSVNVGAVLSGLIARPQDTLSLIRTARQSEKAFAALLRCRHALGSRLLGPDLG
jgi:hopanoid-associated phosphorylase